LQVSELAGVTIDELKRASEDMTAEEVERAKTQMKASMLMGLESPSSRCERLARMLAIWDRVPSLDETVAKIEAVDLGQARDYGAAVTAQSPAVALYGPVGGALEYEALSKRLVA